MQIVDIVILLMLGLGLVVGFKRGFFQQTVKSLGGILVVVLALIFSSSLALFLIEKLPAFNFGGLFKGISSMNILVYELIAFAILLFIFGLIFRLALTIAKIIEKSLDATVVLAIPSRIFGALMGLIEAYVIIFVILYILTLPVFNITLINDSKYKPMILESTPLMSSIAAKTVDSFKQIYVLKDQLSQATNRLDLDQKVLNILKENNLISAETANGLFEKGKINTK